MDSALKRTYKFLNSDRGIFLDDGRYAITGKGTYHKRERIKALGGIWNPDEKYWVLDDLRDVLDLKAVFSIKVRVPAYCHMEEREIYVPHWDVIAGDHQMGCSLCDRRFQSGSPVKILEVVEKNRFEQIEEALDG